jgi:REP element-mobilizing transposase RayT
VPHSRRAPLAPRFPLHVTLRLHRGLPSLRRRPEYAALRAAFAKRCEREAFRLVHYSVQNDHVHMLVEGSDRPSVSVALQGLLISIAKKLNALWQRKGAVFEDRYHDRLLRTPREVRNALVYVLNNARKHGSGQETIDRFASGPWLDGWRGEIVIRGIEGVERPVGTSRTWLMCVGWRRHGLIGWDEVPRAG